MYGRGYSLVWSQRDIIRLEHHDTLILEVDVSGDEPRVERTGGWSCSDRDAINSFAELLGLPIHARSERVGGQGGDRTLRVIQ